MNVARFNQVLDHILAHPETWRQGTWHCGTTHCFAGHAQIMSGKKENSLRACEEASAFLELDGVESKYLFWVTRTLADFKKLAKLAKDSGKKKYLIPDDVLWKYE